MHFTASSKYFLTIIGALISCFQYSSSMARLDKADILELTVSHLTTLHHQHRSANLATTAEGYKKGFKDCARETFNYLSSTQALDSKSLQQLNNRLQTCYLQKNQSGTASGLMIPQPADVTYAHVSSKQGVQATDDYSYPSSYQSDATSQWHNNILQRPGVSYVYGQVHSGRDYYSKLNDSEDSSLNSSCNMSLDSISSITPEKIVPGQSSDEDVWRPW